MLADLPDIFDAGDGGKQLGALPGMADLSFHYSVIALHLHDARSDGKPVGVRQIRVFVLSTCLTARVDRLGGGLLPEPCARDKRCIGVECICGFEPGGGFDVQLLCRQ